MLLFILCLFEEKKKAAGKKKWDQIIIIIYFFCFSCLHLETSSFVFSRNYKNMGISFFIPLFVSMYLFLSKKKKKKSIRLCDFQSLFLHCRRDSIVHASRTQSPYHTAAPHPQPVHSHLNATWKDVCPFHRICRDLCPAPRWNANHWCSRCRPKIRRGYSLTINCKFYELYSWSY